MQIAPQVVDHTYSISIQWTGNRGSGTAGYSAYDRDFQVHVSGKSVLYGSSDPAFRGDSSRYNPEELFLVSVSSCHMLWFLHLASNRGVQVIRYEDEAYGVMSEQEGGTGQFTNIVLRPVVTVGKKEMIDQAQDLHELANRYCFIANSLNFPVHHEPEFRVI